MKLRSIAAILLTTSASTAFAGGFETNALSTSFMYEDGSYAEIGYSSRSYDVKGTFYAPTGSALKDTTSISFALKTNITDNLSIGLSSYNQGTIQLDYSGAGATAPIPAVGLPVVDLPIDAKTLQAKYNVNENISVLLGLKQAIVNDATANIFQSGSLPASTVTGKSEIGYITGVAYSIPEFAFRAELLYETDTDLSLITENLGLGPAAAGTTTGSTPDYMTLNFQSGIAADTLIFGSIRKADWSNHQITVYPNQLFSAEPTSSFTDSVTYNVGIARKVSDSLSLIASYSTEAAGDGTSETPLTITDGYKGVTLAARYTAGNATITAGYNHTQTGDISMTPGAGAPAGEFNNNTVTGFGIKVGFSF